MIMTSWSTSRESSRMQRPNGIRGRAQHDSPSRKASCSTHGVHYFWIMDEASVIGSWEYLGVSLGASRYCSVCGPPVLAPSSSAIALYWLRHAAVCVHCVLGLRKAGRSNRAPAFSATAPSGLHHV